MSGKTRLIDVITSGIDSRVSDSETCIHDITYFTRGGDAVDYFDYKRYEQERPWKFVEVSEAIACGEFSGGLIVRICPYCIEAIGKIEASIIEHRKHIREFLQTREAEDLQEEAALAESHRRMYGVKS